MEYATKLADRAADNPAGAGVAWFAPGAVDGGQEIRSLFPSLGDMVDLLLRRPPAAWGVFHVRRAPPGNRATRWCHPHRVWRGPTRLLLTYAGVAKLAREERTPLWDAATRICGQEPYVNPLLVPWFLSHFPLRGAGELGLPNTVVCYEERDDADQASWRILAWRKHARFPLFRLANGAVSSTDDGTGEWAAEAELPVGLTVIDTEGPAESPEQPHDYAPDGAPCTQDL